MVCWVQGAGLSALPFPGKELDQEKSALKHQRAPSQQVHHEKKHFAFPASTNSRPRAHLPGRLRQKRTGFRRLRNHAGHEYGVLAEDEL